MAIEFRCSQCSQLLRVPDDSAGKNARCPKCQALMVVPPAAGLAQQPEMPAPASPPMTAPPNLERAPPTPLPVPPPPPKPTSLTPDSPFGGAGGTPAGAINPYASAASVGPAYAPQYYWGGPRPGLPWENERQTIGCWFKTTGMLIGSPTQAFSLMRREGGLGTPMLYAIYGMGLPVIAAAMVITPIGLVIALVAGGDDKLHIAAAVLGLSLAITAAVAVWLVIEATLFTIIRAAFLHLMLLIVGGGRHGYETTFRVVSYTRGSLFWCILIPIPYLNLMIMGIWSLVILIIGLSRAHEISGGKAALAIFLPAIAVIGLMLVALVVALLAGVGAAAFSR